MQQSRFRDLFQGAYVWRTLFRPRRPGLHVGWPVSFAWAEEARGRTPARAGALPGSPRSATTGGHPRDLRGSGLGWS